MIARAIDTVVLDLGNVLVHWDPAAAYAGVRTPREVRRFFDDVDFVSFNEQQDAGRSWREARAEVALRWPEHVEMVDLYVERFTRTLGGPVPGMAALVDELRAAGVRVLGLTNWSAETFHHAEPAAPVIGRLDGIVVSGREGVIKPDPRIFGVLAERYGVEPGRSVFVDDTAGNVEAARGLGYRAVLFRGAESLRRALVTDGVLPGGAVHDRP
jgi:2-haloacid dehalogenase